MIDFATKQDADSVLSLWQRAFGDDREWVLAYLDRNIQNVLLYKENDTVCGMLSLLPVSYKNKKGYYVYGVATDENYRNKGISTALLDYAKSTVDSGFQDFLVLVPRNELLFEFYKKRGFFAQACTEKRLISGDELKAFRTDKRAKKVSQKDYFNLRRHTFDNLIEWSAERLSDIRDFENGDFYMTDEKNGAFSYCYGDTLYVKELCGSIETAAAINAELKKDKVIVTEKSDSAPSFMTYPEFAEKLFFNISMD